MDPKTANQLDRLLADGELSGPEADAIFDRVYANVAAAERPGTSRRATYAALWFGAGAAACIASLVTFRSPGPESTALTARGTNDGAPVLAVRCADGTLGACPKSSRLFFSVAGDRTSGFLSAYAEPLDMPGERIWYFSSETLSPQPVGAVDGTRVFDHAVNLGGTHRPGRYRIHAFLAPRPLSHTEMLESAGSQALRMQAEVAITEGQ
jgi:hypothetical protein